MVTRSVAPPPAPAQLISRSQGSQWIQYLYFLRFSLAAWLFLVALCWLDFQHVTSNITRAIMTLDSGWQAFHAAFFVTALQMTVLITTRNTIRNGEARFACGAPPRLYAGLTDPTPRAIWRVLAIAQIPTFLTLAYLAYAAFEEQEQYKLPLLGARSWNIGFFFLAGLAAAFAFWYVVSLFYYWTYRPKGDRVRPAALIFPHELFGDIGSVQPPPGLTGWIDALTCFVLRRFPYTGFADSAAGPLWELHFLSAVSLLGIFLLYVFLYPLTAPVLQRPADYGAIFLAVLVTVALEAGLYKAGDEPNQDGVRVEWAAWVKLLFQALPVIGLGLYVYAIVYDLESGAVRFEMGFPTLASVLVLVNFFLWFCAGAAFFFDRYRIPVLTTLVILMLGPKVVAPYGAEFLEWAHLPWLAERLDLEHYYTVQRLGEAPQLPTPSDVLRDRAADRTQPYIIVTASGGGIRAAEWTAQVMVALERGFAQDPRLRSLGYTFHDHLLLASGVSGGSVGLMPYLLEYTMANPAQAFPDDDAFLARVTNPPACSSLEAVAWGLEYYDLSRLLFTVRFPLPGFLTAGVAPDRTWALTEAFNRNLHDRHCDTERDQVSGLGSPAIRDGNGMTLAASADLLRKGQFPAFTFNTTAAETGGRFLLADYAVPPAHGVGTDFIPADSFLQVYAQPDARLKEYADLPLATAARLSATFPIVSSATRIPKEYTPHAYHFLDGGYYDNDGTGSAIEFLKSALGPVERGGARSAAPLRIVLIEIRDDDGSGVRDQNDLASQNGNGGRPPAAWTTMSQIGAPMQGMWNAGHASISLRNRRELCLLESAYPSRLAVHHVVFTIPNDPDSLSPLSWNLTTRQRQVISRRAYDGATQGTIRQAIDWILRNGDRQAGEMSGEVCTAWIEPPSGPAPATVPH